VLAGQHDYRSHCEQERSVSPANKTSPRGTHIEEIEQRPLDIYDLSSILYLCQQNLTESVFRRYLTSEVALDDPNPEVRVNTAVGDYDVTLTFRVVPTNREIVIPPPGNVSVFTIHQVLQRMNFGHAPELILKELRNVGLAISSECILDTFTLRRYINDTFLTIELAHMAAARQ